MTATSFLCVGTSAGPVARHSNLTRSIIEPTCRHQKILSLDPSSTVVGYAVMSYPRGDLLEGGLITPDSKTAPSYERICCLRRDLRQLLYIVNPSWILIEWTKGKVGLRRHRGLGAGLAVYGAGIGAIAAECEIWAERAAEGGNMAQVIPILENDWTRGVTKKDRTLFVAQNYEKYRISDDPGGDIADAIGLARWWICTARTKKTSPYY